MDNVDINNTAKNKRFLILGSVLVVLLFVLMGVLLFSNKAKNNQQAAVTNTSDATQPIINQRNAGQVARTAIAPPTVSFEHWSGTAQPATQPTSLKSYTFKQSYTLAEVKSFAQKLQAADSISEKNNIVTGYTLDSASQSPSASFLIFNTVSGEYSYRSSKGVALPGSGSVEERVYAFLKNSNWYDNTLKVTSTYRNKAKPGILYVEAHRDWSSAGSPILNSVGLLNIPEKQSLSTLSLQSKSTSTPADKDIYSTSDKKDGFARDVDFNSATFGIDEKTQSIVMIKSNLRAITRVEENTPIIAYDQALSALKNKEYEFILTAPSGDGAAIDWEKVYPQNNANANEAVIMDSAIAYLEESPSVEQKKLIPYYIFRGRAQLTSGYGVLFTAAVSAAPSATHASSGSLFSLVKPVSAQTIEPGQKQGTFDFGSNPSPSINTPGTSVTPTANSTCKPALYELNPVYEANGLKFGLAHYTYWKEEYRESKDGFWYYIPQSNITASLAESNLDAIIKALLTVAGDADIRDNRDKIGYDINKNIPGGQTQLLGEAQATPTTQPEVTMHVNPGDDTGQKQATFNIPTGSQEETYVANPVTNILENYTGACPVRLTGSSPSLFVYASAGSVYHISPNTSLTYADPKIENAQWNVTVNGMNKLTVNTVQRAYIYYEYEKTSFDRPETGWNIKKADVKKWVHETLTKKLGLTPLEEERAAFEIAHAATTVATDNIFVGVIDQHEVDNKLPLAVSPAPDSIKRIHFYVDSANGPVVSPSLSPIARTQSLILEFGSYSK